MREFTVQRGEAVSDKLIADWAITALEGGIGYWCDSAECVERDDHGNWQPLIHEGYSAFVVDGVGPYANPEFWDNDKRGYRLHDEYEESSIDKVLTLSAMLKALQHQPPSRKGVSDNWMRKVVDRLLSEQYDAEDADTLVQIAVFKEVVYG